MDSLSHQSFGVGPLQRCQALTSRHGVQHLVDGDRELACYRVVADDEHRIDRCIPARVDLVEPDDRQVELPSEAKLEVLSTFRAGLVAVLKEAVDLTVRIGAVGRGDDR